MMTIEKICNDAQHYLPEMQRERLFAAYEFAKRAHQGQFRRSGEPYFHHPLETVKILLNMHVDEITLIAALLHDVPEDSGIGIDEIEKHFGKEIAYLVEGITKLSAVHYHFDMQERQIESLKKLFLHSASDVRTILIKLADRLHNMRTVQYVPEQKRLRIVSETIEIFVPVANLLGLWELKAELEDLCFMHLMPNIYTELKTKVERLAQEQQKSLRHMVLKTQIGLREAGIQAEVFGRPKNLYSIYQKMKRSHKNLIDIEDLEALRILVQHRVECYQSLKVVHALFRPKAERVKDYISCPKPNGYQSLHTTVYCDYGNLIEFQIRTHDMHLEAEYGIAAHYFYKNSEASQPFVHPKWIENVLSIQKSYKNGKEFLNTLKIDIFQDRIFVFTPKGDVIDLPQGATALDLAYVIHTDIGHKASYAAINNEKVPLKTLLKTGDTVRIITADSQLGPQHDWLQFVVTTTAKHTIQTYFRKQSRQEKRSLGREVLEKAIIHSGRTFSSSLLRARKIRPILEKTGYTSFDNVLEALGEGDLDVKNFLQMLYPHNLEKFFEGQVFKRPISEQKVSCYPAVLKVYSDDYVGLLHRITHAVSSTEAAILHIGFHTHWKSNTAITHLTLEVGNFVQLSQIFEKLGEIEGVHAVKSGFYVGHVARIVIVVALLIFFCVALYFLYK